MTECCAIVTEERPVNFEPSVLDLDVEHVYATDTDSVDTKELTSRVLNDFDDVCPSLEA